jgi:SNARE protein
MTEEIQFLDDEMRDVLVQVQKGIDELMSPGAKKLSFDARAEKMANVQQRLDRAKKLYQSFKVELRDLQRDSLKEFQAKGNEHNQNITKLGADLQAAKAALERGDLLEGKEAPKPVDLETASTKQVIDHGKAIQAKSAESLGRAAKLVNQSEAIGSETAARLKAQTEQMKGIYSNVDKIEGDLERADKIMRAFMRRMATDKLVLCFILLIIVGIITIVAWKASQGTAINPTPAPTPAPTRRL